MCENSANRLRMHHQSHHQSQGHTKHVKHGTKRISMHNLGRFPRKSFSGARGGCWWCLGLAEAIRSMSIWVGLCRGHGIPGTSGRNWATYGTLHSGSRPNRHTSIDPTRGTDLEVDTASGRGDPRVENLSFICFTNWARSINQYTHIVRDGHEYNHRSMMHRLQHSGTISHQSASHPSRQSVRQSQANHSTQCRMVSVSQVSLSLSQLLATSWSTTYNL